MRHFIVYNNTERMGDTLASPFRFFGSNTTMTADVTEVLVALKTESAGAILEQLRRHYHVTNISHPRLAVLMIDRAGLKALEGFSGVEAVFVKDVPETFRASLEPAERLFAEAWQTRQKGEKKDRPGDKLPWDTPGFLPPDRPPDR